MRNLYTLKNKNHQSMYQHAVMANLTARQEHCMEFGYRSAPIGISIRWGLLKARRDFLRATDYLWWPDEKNRTK